MYASSSRGEPWQIAKAPSTDDGPRGRASRNLWLRGVSFSVVQRAAFSATGLKRSPDSTPQTTLSWLPRIMLLGLRMLRMRSMTWFGLAP